MTRSVKRVEFERYPEAKKAMDDEADELVARKVWDCSKVEEWSAVRARMQRDSTKQVHTGNALGICVERGSELPLGTEGRKFKGRFVFQGNRVFDEYSEAAIFHELGRSPASMEVAKAVDAHGALPGTSSKRLTQSRHTLWPCLATLCRGVPAPVTSPARS